VDDDDLGPEDEFEGLPLDEHESALIERDLDDLAEFEATFRPDGYRGVAVWCPDCQEEHYYPWEMLRENLQLLLETGDTPVHEPAFAPEPDRYVQWDYARGYVDALRDIGVAERLPLDHCPRCGLDLADVLRSANFCPRCGTSLVLERLREALLETGMEEDAVIGILRAAGLPVR
jgi:hypothetical protein